MAPSKMKVVPMRNLIVGLTISLCTFSAAADHMEEVVVNGSHEKRTIDVVDELTIAPDTAQLLKKAPGANVNSNGPLTGIPNYRGMYGPRVGVELNGVQLAPAGPNWMDPPLSYAAAAQLESLQLYRGIAPVSVVQESIGGAINAVTHKGEFTDSKDMAVAGHLVGSGQSVNQGSQLGATLLLSNQAHRLRIAAMAEQGDDAQFSDGDILPSEYQRDRYELGYGFRSGFHTLQFDYSRSETDDTGTPALPMDIDYIDGDLYSASYTYSGEDWALNAKFFGSDLDHGMSNYHLRTQPMNDAMWRRNTTDSENRGFKVTASFQDDRGSWILGADGLASVHNSDIDNPNNPMFFVTNFNEAERDVYGLFVERQHEFGNAWSAEFGLRYNRVEMDADEVDGTPAMMMPPAMALRDAFNGADRQQSDDNIDAVAKVWYEANDDLSLYVGLGRKNRSPAYQERYLWLPLQATGGLADGLTYTGNIELKPEVAHEIELGFDLNSGGLTLSPRLFYRDVKDYIQGTATGVIPAVMFSTMMGIPQPLQFNNVDAAIYGFDMDWSYDLSASWALSGLINYVRGERDDVDDNLYRIAPLNGSVKLAYRANQWGGGVEAILFDDQDKTSATNNEQPSDGYGLINVSAYWQATAGLRLALGVDNALDEDYADHLSGVYRVTGNPDIAQGERIPGYGRNLFARIDYQF